MRKHHINKKGVPAPCNALIGKCPFGDEGAHFNSKEEAQAFIDKKGEQNHELLPGIKKTKQPQKENKSKIIVTKQLLEFDRKMANNMSDYFTYERRDNEFKNIEQEVNPDDLADKYFIALISSTQNGTQMDFNEFDYKWENEVKNNKVNYKDKADFDRDIESAHKMNQYYEGQKDFINDVFQKARETDWSESKKTHGKGVIDAVKYIYIKKNYR